MSSEAKEVVGQLMDDKQLALEWARTKFGFWKFVIGTAAVSVLTAVLNWQIQYRELQLQEINSQNEFMAKFVQLALDDVPEKRRDFAEYFARVAPTEEAQDRWKQYRNYAIDLVNESKARKARLEQVEREASRLRDEERKAAADRAAAEEQRRLAKIALEKAQDETERKKHKAELEKIASAYDEAQKKATEARVEVENLQNQISGDRLELASLRSEPQIAQMQVPRDAELARAKEREGFQRLIDLDFKGALEAFEAAESAYPSYHQVYEVARLIRKNRASWDDSKSRLEMLETLVSDMSWGAPEDLLALLKEMVQKERAY